MRDWHRLQARCRASSSSSHSHSREGLYSAAFQSRSPLLSPHALSTHHATVAPRLRYPCTLNHSPCYTAGLQLSRAELVLLLRRHRLPRPGERLESQSRVAERSARDRSVTAPAGGASEKPALLRPAGAAAGALRRGLALLRQRLSGRKHDGPKDPPGRAVPAAPPLRQAVGHLQPPPHTRQSTDGEMS